MPGPFFNNIKAVASGTPGTGAFTPNAAASGSFTWVNVPTGWMGLVRYEDGTDAELSYSYWDGSTLSRSATQFVQSTTGTRLSLTSSATAALVIDANAVQPHLKMNNFGWAPNVGAATYAGVGTGVGPGITGTAAAATIAATNYLTTQQRVQLTSATTANAQAGLSVTTVVALVSTTSDRGGFEFTARFGCSQLPTGPRAFIGLTSSTFLGSTGEPSALVANYAALAKDSTDTNFQFLCNSNAGSGTKIDTGIALAANGWYEVSIWCDPGSNTMSMRLFRLDTGAIYYGSTATDVPATGALMQPNVIVGLSSTTGTAIVFHTGQVNIRTGGK